MFESAQPVFEKNIALHWDSKPEPSFGPKRAECATTTPQSDDVNPSNWLFYYAIDFWETVSADSQSLQILWGRGGGGGL